MNQRHGRHEKCDWLLINGNIIYCTRKGVEINQKQIKIENELGDLIPKEVSTGLLLRFLFARLCVCLFVCLSTSFHSRVSQREISWANFNILSPRVSILQFNLFLKQV